MRSSYIQEKWTINKTTKRIKRPLSIVLLFSFERTEEELTVGRQIRYPNQQKSQFILFFSFSGECDTILLGETIIRVLFVQGVYVFQTNGVKKEVSLGSFYYLTLYWIIFLPLL